MDTIKIRRRFEELKQERSGWEPLWRDIRDYVVPHRGRGLSGDGGSEVNRGELRDRKRVKGTASMALGVLASGMQSGLTSKARQWFYLSNPDPDIDRIPAVRKWYDKVQEVLEGVFRRSNIYQAFRHCYAEMGAFGQGAVLVPEHPDKVLYCRSFTAGTYWMDTDPYGDVDTFFYREWLTAPQLESAYGRDALPEGIRSRLDSGDCRTRFSVVNAIMKHPEKVGFPLRKGDAAGSIHFLERGGGPDSVLRVSGYTDWPVMTPRWDVIDTDVYGHSPVMDILGDVKSLQSMTVDSMKTTAKGVNPPLQIPPEMERRGINVQPGGLNVSGMPNAITPLYIPAVNLQQLQLMIEDIKQDIKDGLYNSLFLALISQDNPQMTAREVQERHEEKLLMLGPVLERIHSELLDPVVDRAYSLCLRAGLIPPPPEELEGSETQVDYVSILSQAQKAVGVGRLEQITAYTSGVVAMYPEARHILKPEELVREYARMIGVRASVLCSEDEYRQAVEGEEQAQQMQGNAAMAEPLANAAKAVSEVDRANVQALVSGLPGGGLI